MIWKPTVEQIMLLHKKMARYTGGSEGVRDSGLIQSGLLRADAGFGDYELYPAAIEKAAAVCCGLIGNHGFVDGNKRIGVAAMLLMLRMNGVAIVYTQQELTEFGLKAAQGLLDVEACVEWICAHRI